MAGLHAISPGTPNAGTLIDAEIRLVLESLAGRGFLDGAVGWLLEKIHDQFMSDVNVSAVRRAL